MSRLDPFQVTYQCDISMLQCLFIQDHKIRLTIYSYVTAYSNNYVLATKSGLFFTKLKTLGVEVGYDYIAIDKPNSTHVGAVVCQLPGR